MRSLVISLALVALAAPAVAQHPPATPYAGFERRQITSLSEAQIADLRRGAGAGLALAAELNGYPGPVHVLELAGPLGLGEAQRRRMEELVAAMRAETIALGERLIAQEAHLDQQFATGEVTAESLADQVRTIAATQAALRTAHLRYHLATVEVLTPSQISRYRELRGYGSGPRHHPGKDH